MVKAEIRPPSSSSPEPLASAIKHAAAERAAEPRLPITDAFPPPPHPPLPPCQAPACCAQHPWDPPGPPLPPSSIPLSLSLAEVPLPPARCLALVLSPNTAPPQPRGVCRTWWHLRWGWGPHQERGSPAPKVLGLGLGWVRGQFGKGKLLFCNKAGKYFPWKMTEPKHFHFSGEKYLVFPSRLDPLTKLT